MWLLASIHSAVGTFQTATIDYFDLKESIKGLPSSIVSFCAIAAFILVMTQIGRRKKSRMLLWALIFGAAALCLIVLKMPFALFAAMMAAVGLCTGVIDSLASGVVTEMYPGHGGLMCLLHATYGMAGFCMPFIFRIERLTGGEDGWKNAYLLIGLMMLGVWTVLLFTVRKYGSSLEAEPETKDIIRPASIKRVISSMRLLPLFASSILGGMYLNTILVWTPRLMEFGKDSQLLSTWVLPAVYLGITVSRLLMSVLKIGMRRYLIVFLLVSAIAILAAILMHSGIAVLIAIFVSIFGYGPTIPFELTLAGKEMPQDRFVVTVSMMFVMMLGQAIASPLIGMAESAWGIESAMYIALATLIGCWIAATQIHKNDNKA